MENLNNIKLTDLGSNLLRVGDLAYFEGPLLTLFENVSNGSLYLYDWVDRNDNTNRWLIYQVDSFALHNFITSKITHEQLFNSLSQKKIYFTDIVDFRSNHKVYEFENLPSKYLPTQDFFDISDCNSYSKIKAVVLKSLMRRKQENQYNVKTTGIIRVIKSHTTIKNRLILPQNFDAFLQLKELEKSHIATVFNSMIPKQQRFLSSVRNKTNKTNRNLLCTR